MRKRIIIITVTIFSLLPVLLSAFSGTVSALNTGFSTEQFPEEKISKFISNVNISLLTEEPVRTAIKCFDVNDYEMIAIGQQVFDEKTVCVYSKDGVFQYGYSLNCDGNIGDVNLEQYVKILTLFIFAVVLEFSASVKEPSDTFEVTILSEKHICESCQGVVDQFTKMYPNAKVNIVSGKLGYNGDPAGKKTWKYRKRMK